MVHEPPQIPTHNPGAPFPHLDPMTLHYLEFDYSEDDDGIANWDAIAHVPSAQVPAWESEVVAVLAWAHAEFPGQQGAWEDGGTWDFDLQHEPGDGSALQPLRYDAASRRLLPAVGGSPGKRHSLTFSLSGTQSFAEAFRQRFSPD